MDIKIMYSEKFGLIPHPQPSPIEILRDIRDVIFHTYNFWEVSEMDVI